MPAVTPHTVAAAIRQLEQHKRTVSVRAVHQQTGGSFRDIAPLLRAHRQAEAGQQDTEGQDVYVGQLQARLQELLQQHLRA